MKREDHSRKRLLFRRQFILGPRFVEGFPSWKRIEAETSIRLTVHPDLPAHERRSQDRWIVLLGYILDPFRPEDRDAEILQRLLRHIHGGGTRESLIRLTHPLGGRWVLIVDDGRSRWLFTDPCGYRQVFYARTQSRGLWCASQTGILAEVLDVVEDRDAMVFLRAYRRREPEFWWPGDRSPYKEIHHLQPNHYLDLETGACHRFWPDGDLATRTPEEVIPESAQLLQGLIQSASRRFELAHTITAGWDTRLILAASRAIRDRLYCFTLMYWNLTRNSRDIRIPSILLPRLGLTHHVVVCPSRMEKWFREIYTRNVTMARICHGPIAQGMYEHLPEGRVIVKGNAMPITRSSWRRRLRSQRPDLENQSLDAETLAWLTGRPEPFAVEAIKQWLSRVGRSNVHVLDLLYWEEREGNWQATSQSEWDIVQEAFVPFNCRLLLTKMLSLPLPEREKPANKAQRNLLLYLWPEVLSEPCNPPEEVTLIPSIVRLLGNLQSKIAMQKHQTFNNPVTRAFQRHPWLTGLNRLGG